MGYDHHSGEVAPDYLERHMSAETGLVAWNL
jgi:hypothetical protein